MHTAPEVTCINRSLACLNVGGYLTVNRYHCFVQSTFFFACPERARFYKPLANNIEAVEYFIKILAIFRYSHSASYSF